jgi:hypothetical protein
VISPLRAEISSWLVRTCIAWVTPARRHASMSDRNSCVSGSLFPRTRSCAINSHRANQTSNLARPLATAVCEVWIAKAWMNFTSCARSVVLPSRAALKLATLIRRLCLRVWRPIAASHDGRSGHALTANDADLDPDIAQGLCDDRGNGILDKEDILDRLVRYFEVFPELKLDRNKVRLKQVTIAR